MRFKESILFLFLLINYTEAFAGKLEKAFERLRVYDYFNAKKYFEKILDDEPAAAAFGLSKIYSVENNPFYNPDEARRLILIADSAFGKIKEKDRKNYSVFGITDSSIRRLSNFICEDAYRQCKIKGTAEGFNNYLKKFSTCSQYEEVHLLRNSAAYMESTKANTSAAYKEFMARFPESRQYKEALDKFNERTYIENTRENDLASYENFILYNPESPYRSEAERKIFTLNVPDKTLEQYSAFVRNYSHKMDTKDAWHALYKLFMKDYSMERYNNFKDSFPDYPNPEEVENDFRIQNYIFLPIINHVRWGYVNEYGVEMIVPVYDEASFFSEGLGAVGKNGKYGFINKSGEVVIDFLFNDVEAFHKGAAVVLKDSLYGLINALGDYLIPPMYDELSETSSDLYIASKAGNYGYIFKDGKTLTPFEFDIAGDFKNGSAIVSKDEKYGLINTTGTFLLKPVFNELNFINDSLLKASNEDELLGIIDVKGDTILPFQYDAIGEFSEHRALVTKNEKCGYVNEQGELVIPIVFSYSSALLTTALFENGYALLKQKNKSIIIDSTGKVLKFRGYEDYKRPFLGLIPVQKNKKWGFVNEKGQQRIPCKYESVESFVDTLAIIKQGGAVGLIDTSGVVFIQPLYQDLIVMKKAIRIKNNNQWGLLSRSGTLYVSCQYQQIELLTPEIAQARNENGFTYINLRTGKIIYNSKE
jgi:hypothetical protein